MLGCKVVKAQLPTRVRAVGDGAQQRALAGVGEPDQADVGQQLELEGDLHGHGLVALGGEHGPRVVLGGEVRVAQPAEAARGQEDGLGRRPRQVQVDGSGRLVQEPVASG